MHCSTLSHQTRQLNLWGFKRELRGPNSLGETYFHKDFKRGKVETLQLIQRTEIKRRSVKKQLPDLHSSKQSSIMTSNAQSQAGDITQGASFLTGLKGASDVLRSNVVTGGGLPTASYYGNMQGPGQINTMIPFNAPSRPPAIAPESTQMFQSQIMPQMMMQPQMFQGYSTGNWNRNWNPNNQLSREVLDKMPTQQLVAMASNINGFNMNSLNLLQSKDGPRAIPSLSSSLSSTLPSSPKIDVSSNEGSSTLGNITTRAA